MAESTANWDQVGEDFKTLGRQVKQHYEQRPRAEAGAPNEGAADQGAPSADRRKVDDALQKLTDALEQAFSAERGPDRDLRRGQRALQEEVGPDRSMVPPVRQ